MMLMKNFKPEVKTVNDMAIVFYTDEDGNDWYESQKLFSANTLKIMYDNKGNVIASAWDISMLAPDNLSVTEVRKAAVPVNFFDSGTRWVFNGKKIVPFEYTNDELRELAENKRAELLIVANDKIIPLQARLSVGRQLTAEQLNALNNLLDYIDELEACDPMAEGFTWPELSI